MHLSQCVHVGRPCGVEICVCPPCDDRSSDTCTSWVFLKPGLYQSCVLGSLRNRRPSVFISRKELLVRPSPRAGISITAVVPFLSIILNAASLELPPSPPS